MYKKTSLPASRRLTAGGIDYGIERCSHLRARACANARRGCPSSMLSCMRRLAGRASDRVAVPALPLFILPGMRRRRHEITRKAFTLLELLVVLAIIAVLV